jgi:hypothetical protein
MPLTLCLECGLAHRQLPNDYGRETLKVDLPSPLRIEFTSFVVGWSNKALLPDQLDLAHAPKKFHIIQSYKASDVQRQTSCPVFVVALCSRFLPGRYSGPCCSSMMSAGRRKCRQVVGDHWHSLQYFFEDRSSELSCELLHKPTR